MGVKKKIVILTGAGMSRESGLKTFREAGGLWESYDIMEVASPIGWAKNTELVLDFYNERRKQLKKVEANIGHKVLVELEDHFNTVVVTQNIDDLHERAGSSHIIHLHGELFKVRSTGNPNLIYEWREDLVLGDLAEDGHQLRPHIVWFGEAVPQLEVAISQILSADIVIVIGTSMVVYPAASLVDFAPDQSTIYYIDPNPNINYELSLVKNLTIISEKASIGCPRIVKDLINKKGS